MQKMSFLKLMTAKLSPISLPAKKTTDISALTLRRRVLVTVATRPLRSKKDDEEASACEKTKEAAEAVKDGAKEVRHTCEFMRDTVEKTTKTMTKMTKNATEKVSEAADNIKDKTQGTVSGAWGVAKNTAEIIKDKVVGK